MKATELMIGDFIRTIYAQKIIKVREIKQSCIYTNDNGYEYNEIEPIPLTAEILEKNGFEDIGDDIYQLEEKPYWFWVDFFNHQYGCEYDTSTYENEDDEHRLKLYGIPSVHELQHAMRICGIEKEIEI